MDSVVLWEGLAGAMGLPNSPLLAANLWHRIAVTNRSHKHFLLVTPFLRCHPCLGVPAPRGFAARSASRGVTPPGAVSRGERATSPEEEVRLRKS